MTGLPYADVVDEVDVLVLVEDEVVVDELVDVVLVASVHVGKHCAAAVPQPDDPDELTQTKPEPQAVSDAQPCPLGGPLTQTGVVELHRVSVQVADT